MEVGVDVRGEGPALLLRGPVGEIPFDPGLGLRLGFVALGGFREKAGLVGGDRPLGEDVLCVEGGVGEDTAA